MAKPSVLEDIIANRDNLPDPLTTKAAPKKAVIDSIIAGTDNLPDPLEEEMAAKDFAATIEPPMGTTDPALLRMAELRGRVLRAGQKCPPGIDCSRYTSTVLGRLGSKVNGSAVQQYHKTERVNLPNLTPGDLVFFDNGRRDTYNTVGKRVGNRFVNHVGIYIGEGKFIQDPGKGSDRRRGEPIDLAQYVRDLKASNPKAAFMGGGRVSDLHQQPASQRPGGTLPPPAPLPGQQPLIQPGLGQQMQEQLVTNLLPGIADSEAALAAKAGQIQPNTTATINSPVGPITITEYPGVGYEVDIPGVGKVKGENYAAVLRNALKQAKINAEQAATVKGHPNEAAYIPSSDVRPPNVNLGQEGTLGAGINNKHLTDKQKYEGVMAEIDKVGAWMADQLKQMTPEAGLIKLADEAGIPVPDTARALATVMPDAVGNMAGQFAMSPVRWAAKTMVLGSDEYSTQEKLETAAGLLLEAATTDIGLTGRSAMDSMLEWAGKKFGSPEKFKAALDKLKLEPNQRAVVETGIDTYMGPGTIGPARKAIKGVDNEADVARGFVRDADAAKRSKNATGRKTQLQPTTDQDALMARARGEAPPPGSGRVTGDQDAPGPYRSAIKRPSTVTDTAAKAASLGSAGGAAPEAAGAGADGAAAGGARETAQEAGIRGLHLSNDPNITHLDPERLGTGPNATTNDKSAAVKGTWVYPIGAQVERAVANSTKHAYEVNFKPGEIYDLTKDPQGLMKSVAEETGLQKQGLMDAINRRLKEQGFKGVSMDQDGQPFRIFSFDKVETTPSIHPGPVGKSKGPLAKSALSDLEAGIHNTLNVPVEKDGGGWTFNPHKWFARHDTPGFTVGGVVPSKIVKDSELTPQLIKKFADDNAELLRDPTRRVGLWKDPDSKDVYIDVVDIMDDKEKALVTAEARGEKAIGRFDENGRYAEEIPLPKKADTGATTKPAQLELKFDPAGAVEATDFYKGLDKASLEAQARLKGGINSYKSPKGGELMADPFLIGSAAKAVAVPAKMMKDLVTVAMAEIVKTGYKEGAKVAYTVGTMAKRISERYGIKTTDARKAVDEAMARLAAPIKHLSDKRTGRYDLADLIAADFAEPEEIAKYGLTKAEVAKIKKIVKDAGGIDNIKGKGGDKAAKAALAEIFDGAASRPKLKQALANHPFLKSKEYADARRRWKQGPSSYYTSTRARARSAGRVESQRLGGNSGKIEWGRMVEDAALLVKGKVIQTGETVSSVTKAMMAHFPDIKPSPKTMMSIIERAEQLLKEADIPLPKSKELPGGVAMANSVTNTVRKLIGEDIYLGTDPQTIEQWAAAAEKAGYTTAEGAHQIAKDILSIVKPWKRSLTPEETIGMATALDGLVAKFDDMSKKYLESASKGGDLAQSEALDLVRQQITDIVQASNKAGAEWARSGMARQAIMKADNSAAGIIARRHKQLERELTEDEIADAVADAEALKKVVDEQKVHIATLEREQADRAYRRYLNELRAKGPRSSDQVKEIDARIKDVGARIKEKWAAAAYPPEDKGGLLMAFSPLSPERLSQLAAVAPDVKELIDLYVKKGFTSAKEHIAEVIKALKQFTGQEFSEDDILAIALGKAKAAAEKVDRPKTAKELFDAEARAMWNDAAKEHSERVRYITQREREVVRKYQGAQREQELALLRQEREALKAEEAARKEAEKAFYASQKAEAASEALDAKNRAAAARAQAQISERASKAADAAEYKAAKEAEQFANSAEKQAAREQAAKEAKAAREEMMADAKDAREAEAFYNSVVRDEQKAFTKEQLNKARLDRKESIMRWKASVGGKRAAAMNRIERLNKKIEYFDQTGQVLGAKSKLPEPMDDTLQKLKLEEAALRNKMAQKEAQAQAQDAYDRMPEWRKTFKMYNPWTLTRSVVASTDNSFLMNQGGMALFSDPKSWARGAGSSFRSITSKGYDNVMAEIRADKDWYEKAEASGLFEGNANLQDIYGTDVISKIPGVGNSQTMYEGGSNALRFDMFKAWSSMAESGGKTLDVADYRAIAKEVKTWTGQGAWGKNVQSLSKPFFALRYRLSQFETALGAPLLRTFRHGMETGNYGPFKVIAKKYAQGYGTMAVTAGLTNQALAAFGPKDSSGKPMLQLDLDPRSTNFGRLVRRVNGRTSVTWDILPPQLRTIGLMAKIGLGEKITTSGNELDSSDYKNKDLRETEIGRYATNGLHPVLAAMWAYAKGSDSKDNMYFNKSQDFSGSQAWKDLAMGFAPISIQTVKEIWDNKDLSLAEKLIGTVTAPLINTGVQEQKRSGGKKKSGPSFGGAPKGGGFKKASFAGAP